jgi:hypothetical protein
MDTDEQKADALKFLDVLHTGLEESLPGPEEMEKWIRDTVVSAKEDPRRKQLRNSEAAFLNGKVLPILFDSVKRHGNLTEARSQEALLNEYFRGTRQFATASPARGLRHPFKKLLSISPAGIYQQWRDGSQSALSQSCPDLALRAPFPHTIVFEGKYFSRGSRATAERELVENVYQAFFYRGLPPITPKPPKVGWGYDYACLLAYDASPTGTLRSAWEDLKPAVRKGFWDGANVYVMIVRGQK